MEKICKIENCCNDVLAKGMCSKHYRRCWIGQDPYIKTQYEKTSLEIFEEKTTLDPATGCVEWTGYRNRQGYGIIRVGKNQVLAHRFSWEITNGPIPDGMCVLHRCDNPPCCNINHLFLGTKTDNIADKVAKGRQARTKGETHGMARLTETDVSKIRKLLIMGRSQRSIARRFGVSNSAINKIKLGKSWIDD